MSLPNAKILVTNDWPNNKGWYFGVLGPIPTDGSDPEFREQFENPLFTRDYDNQEFEAGIVYFFYARHPLYFSEPEYARVVFDVNGGYSVLSPEENPSGEMASDGRFIGLDSASEGQLIQIHFVNGSPYLIPSLQSLYQLVLAASVNERENSINALKIRLSQLSELISTLAITLSGAQGEDLKRNLPGTTTGGMQVLVDSVLKLTLGRLNDSVYGVQDEATGNRIALQGENAILDGKRILSGNSELLLKSLFFTQLTAATADITGLFAPQINPVTGESQQVVASRAQVFSYILPNLSAWVQANGGLGAGMPTGSNAGPIEAIYCHQVPIAAQPNQKIAISPANVNTWITHNLQTSGDNIFWILRDSAGRNADSIAGVTFNSANNYEVKVVIGESAIAADFTGTLWLQKLQTT